MTEEIRPGFLANYKIVRPGQVRPGPARIRPGPVDTSILNIIILIWFMINGKEPLIVKDKVGSSCQFFLQSASNSVIYEIAISSKLIVNKNNI